MAKRGNGRGGNAQTNKSSGNRGAANNAGGGGAKRGSTSRGGASGFRTTIPAPVLRDPDTVKQISAHTSTSPDWHSLGALTEQETAIFKGVITESDNLQPGSVIFAMKAAPQEYDADSVDELPLTARHTAGYSQYRFDSMTVSVMAAKGALTALQIGLGLLVGVTIEEFLSLSDQQRFSAVDFSENKVIFNPSPDARNHLTIPWFHALNFLEAGVNERGIIVAIIYTGMTSNNLGGGTDEVKLTARMSASNVAVRFPTTSSASSGTSFVVGDSFKDNMAPNVIEGDVQDATAEIISKPLKARESLNVVNTQLLLPKEVVSDNISDFDTHRNRAGHEIGAVTQLNKIFPSPCLAKWSDVLGNESGRPSDTIGQFVAWSSTGQIWINGKFAYTGGDHVELDELDLTSVALYIHEVDTVAGSGLHIVVDEVVTATFVVVGEYLEFSLKGRFLEPAFNDGDTVGLQFMGNTIGRTTQGIGDGDTDIPIGHIPGFPGPEFPFPPTYSGKNASRNIEAMVNDPAITHVVAWTSKLVDQAQNIFNDIKAGVKPTADLSFQLEHQAGALSEGRNGDEAHEYTMGYYSDDNKKFFQTLGKIVHGVIEGVAFVKDVVGLIAKDSQTAVAIDVRPTTQKIHYLSAGAVKQLREEGVSFASARLNNRVALTSQVRKDLFRKVRANTKNVARTERETAFVKKAEAFGGFERHGNESSNAVFRSGRRGLDD